MSNATLRAEAFLSDLSIDDYNEIDTLFAECIDLKVSCRPLPGFDGCLLRLGDFATILCNSQSAYPARRRFTIAHELGHCFLHPNQSQDFLLTEENAARHKASPMEAEANAFAGSLLMPRAGFNILGHFVFPKRYTSTTRYVRYQHECAYLLGIGFPSKPESTIGDVIDWTYSGNKLHPTQKPISALLPRIETFSRKEDIVLDPFAGSGSSLVAAKMLGRKYIGIEMDAGYHAAACTRLSERS